LTLWRISFYEALDGIGAFRGGGRWNSRGRHAVYLADSPAGAMLETLVHLPLDESDWPNRYKLLRVEIAGAAEPVDLPPPLTDWQENLAATQRIGDAWLAERWSALARVPSAIVPFTWNYLLNPSHPDAAKAKAVEATEHLYDPRLLQIRGV
jgi:RES domain-containing protein